MENGRLLIEEYEVNSSTIILLPIVYGSRIFTKIHELEEDSISPFKPLEIVKESCYSFGSTYDGRKEAAKKLIGAVQKVPIAVSPLIYLFPTTSPENPHCVWVAQEHVVDYKRGEEHCTTIVKFSNNLYIPLPISLSSFENQLIRTVMLKTKILKSKDIPTAKTIYSSKIRKSNSAEEPENYFW